MQTSVAICLLAAGQGLFLGAVLFLHRRGNVEANRLLALLIVLFSLRLAEFASYWTGFIVFMPHALFSTAAFQFLFGPLLYAYARTLLDGTFTHRISSWLHGIPFAIQIGYLLPFYSQPGNIKQAVYEQSIQVFDGRLSPGFLMIETSQSIHLAIYCLIVFFLSRGVINNKRTDSLTSIRFKWLQRMIAGFALFLVLDIVHLLELVFFGYEYIAVVDLGLMFFQAAFVYTIGYMAIRSPELHVDVVSRSGSIRYEKSSLTAELASEYLRRLTVAMETDRLYRDSDLNLRTLAEKVQIHSHHLSQVLNEQLQVNFFDFVNRYRIEEAKQRLVSEASDQTILGIAMEVGFNNKASFNSAFKKYAGQTPREFRANPQ